MQEQPGDLAVIQQVLQGQQSAYAILVARYQSYVFTLVMRYVNSREVAEELSQDVFIKAYRFLADFKGDSKFSTWLYTIVNSTCLSHLRKKRNETIPVEEEKIIYLSDSVTDKPADQLEQKTTKKLLTEAMARLPCEDAQVLTLFYVAEQSLDEIAIILGTTPGNVKVRLFRARKKLKDILATRYSKELL
jgi:RNA polymerase sigma factor (sigma-70 family)